MRIDERQIRLYFDDQFAVCAPDLQMSRHKGEGYVVADTRLASGYRIRVAGVEPALLGAVRTAPHAARFEFTNPALDATSGSVEANTLHLRVDRSLGHGVHDDYDLTNFGSDTVEVVLEVSVECDFADVFDMKDHRLVRRGSLQTTWAEATSTLTSRYRNASFTRALELVVDRNDAAPEYANGGISFRVRVAPFESWHTCLLWIPEIDGEAPRHPARLCHDLLGTDTIADQARREWVNGASSFSTSDPSVDQTITRSVQDLASLRLHIFDDLAVRVRARHRPRWVERSHRHRRLGTRRRCPVVHDALRPRLARGLVANPWALGPLRRRHPALAGVATSDRLRPGT